MRGNLWIFSFFRCAAPKKDDSFELDLQIFEQIKSEIIQEQGEFILYLILSVIPKFKFSIVHKNLYLKLILECQIKKSSHFFKFVSNSGIELLNTSQKRHIQSSWL